MIDPVEFAAAKLIRFMIVNLLIVAVLVSANQVLLNFGFSVAAEEVIYVAEFFGALFRLGFLFFSVVAGVLVVDFFYK